VSIEDESFQVRGRGNELPSTRRAAIRTVATHAKDAEDFQQVCSALGLDPAEVRTVRVPR
jgi:hypothetical protein